MKDLQDLTSTSFGLVIAYLLPGLAGLGTLGFWSAELRAVFTTFTTIDANLGLFLVVILAAFLVGLQITLLRWLLFEWFWFGHVRKRHLTPERRRRIPERLSAYRAVVDEFYRYHQFWGGIAVIIPVALYGWWQTGNGTAIGLMLSAGGEILTIVGAVQSYQYYVDAATQILARKPDPRTVKWE